MSTSTLLSLFIADGSETVINKEKYACLQSHSSLIYAMRRHRPRIQVFTYREGRVRPQKVISLHVQPRRPKLSFAVTNEHILFVGADNKAKFISKDNGAMVGMPQPEMFLTGEAYICQVNDAETVLCSAGAGKLYKLQCHSHVIPVKFTTSQQDTIFGAGKLNGRLFVGAGKTLTMFTCGESHQEASQRQKQKSRTAHTQRYMPL